MRPSLITPSPSLTLLLSVIILGGCTTQVERPRAQGLIDDPMDRSDQANQRRMVQILAAATPIPQLPDPDTAWERNDPRLEAWVERIAFLIRHQQYPEAQRMVEHLKTTLQASIDHDQLLITLHQPTAALALGNMHDH